MNRIHLSKNLRCFSRRIAPTTILATGLIAGRLAAAPVPAAAILQDLHRFDVLGTVLYVAAHPDDENTTLIAYLARGRHYRTAYLSLTRGGGGQNVKGPQFGDELGYIRTHEQLAARQIDGGRQFFSQAVDFGYSKSYKEALRIWNRQKVLGDVVRIIREYQPDIVITRFSPESRHTHGHHTASAILALQAFKLAGDPKAYPEQLQRLQPWQPKRIFWNGWGLRGNEGNGNPIVRINIAGKDPVSGESFGELGARGRSMNKTQGFGNFRGFRGGGGPRYEAFELLAGAPATNDIMDGVDTTWARVPGGAEIGRLTDQVIAQFNSEDPAASVPALLRIKRRLAALTPDRLVRVKRRQLDRVIQECLGLSVETTIRFAEVVPGEPLELHQTAVVHSSVVPIRWIAARFPSIHASSPIGQRLTPNTPLTHTGTETLPADTPLSQPYWLRQPHGTGTFRVADPQLIGRPLDPPVFPIREVFEVGGQRLVVHDQPIDPKADRANGETRHLKAISPVSLKFATEVKLFAPGASHPIDLEVTSARPDVEGELRLNAPSGWKVTPEQQPFHLGTIGDHAQFKFNVTAPAQPATASLTAAAEVNGKPYDNERVVINYSYLPLMLLQPTARVKAVCLHLAVRGRDIGYLPGAGDSVAQSLKDMGCHVTMLTGSDLTPQGLKGLDTVVVGIRAFNVRHDLAAHLSALFDFVKSGGNLIEQYNRPRGLQTDRFAPYELHVSGDRVTDETAPMTFLVPDHPALNTPNKITSTDFDGWIQERGVYFPNRWDSHFVPILSCHDPGEAPLKGSLLVARYGQGYIVYTGLDFFRQLPAGVPGAYRLFANLVSLGK